LRAQESAARERVALITEEISGIRELLAKGLQRKPHLLALQRDLAEIGEAGLRLSGGQRQRIGLARALFGNPRLVVLDEPNASLDSEGEAALLDAIAHLKAQGTTVVIIAHRSNVLALADKLLVLRNGAIDLFGDCGEVIAQLNGAAAARSRGAIAKQQVA